MRPLAAAAATAARRVGTGISEADRKDLRERIKPLLLNARAPGVRAPSCYVLTGREKPDVWCGGPGERGTKAPPAASAAGAHYGGRGEARACL
jgi:hypothetical protein